MSKFPLMVTGMSCVPGITMSNSGTELTILDLDLYLNASYFLQRLISKMKIGGNTSSRLHIKETEYSL
jgi:hypothetical protein